MFPRSLCGIVAIALTILWTAPALASPPTATRSLPSSAESEGTFDVLIEVSGCGKFGQVVENLPAGFTYLGCRPEDLMVTQQDNTLKFTFIGDSVSFAYSVKAPRITATTTYVFTGLVKDEDRNEYPLPDSAITVVANGSSTTRYVLTIEVEGSGSTTPMEGRHYYDAGEIVQIRAQPSSGWVFDRWGGDVANRQSPTTTVRMDEDKRVTAYFIKLSPRVFILEISCQPENGGTVSLSPPPEDNHYESGTSVELTAIPSEGFVFRGWSGDVEDSTNPIHLTMDSDKRLIANFEPRLPPSPETMNSSLPRSDNQPATTANGVGHFKLDTGTTLALVVIGGLIAGIVVILRRLARKA